MLSISFLDLPSQYPISGSSIIGVLSSTLGVGYAVTAIYDQEKPFLFIEGTLTIPSYISLIEIDIAAQNIGAIQEIKIAGEIYTLTDYQTPQPGEYYYSPKTKTLTINPVNSPRQGDNIYFSGLTETSQVVRTTQIIDNVPSFFGRWKVYGSAQFSRDFQGHPVATFNFIASGSSESSIVNTFSPDSSFTFYGVSYESRQLQINYIPDNNKIQVTINFQGRHAPKGLKNPLDQPIKLEPFTNKETVTLSQLGSAIGVSILGSSRIKVPIDKDISDDATTTLRRELESRAASIGCFVDYSRLFPQLKEFGKTPIRYLSRGDVLEKRWGVSYGGTGDKFQGVPLSYEIHNVRLKLEKEENEQGDEFIPLFEGDPNPTISPDLEKQFFRSNKFAFDMNGPTKTQREISLVNSTTLKEVIKVYGFIYNESDTYVVSLTTRLENPSDPNSSEIETYEIRFAEPTFDAYWGQTKYLEINHIYNPETGDYETAPGTGWELTRFLKSNSNLEICELIGQKLLSDDEAEQAQIQKVIDAYAFFTNPITSATNFQLESYSDYYEDATGEDEPKFANLTTQTENSYASIPDPRIGDDEQTLPALVVGTNRIQETRRTIASTENELYKESETVSNAEGSDFGETAKAESYRDVRGRPPLQPRFKEYGRRQKPRTPEESNKIYRVSTPLALSLDNNELFPLVSGIKTLEQAKVFIDTVVAIENSSNAVRLQIQIVRQPDWMEGDIIVFDGDKWVLLSVKETQVIQRNGVWYRPVAIELGMLLEPKVTTMVES